MDGQERYLDEMAKQVGDVLLRATTQEQRGGCFKYV